MHSSRGWVWAASAVLILGCSGVGLETTGEDEQPSLGDPADDNPSQDNFVCPSGPCLPNGCGNGICTANESCSSCPSDCGACAPGCGDGLCSPGEGCVTCPQDCGSCLPSCGNGICSPNESCTSCPADCGACPCAHDTCATGSALSESCDPCVAQICAVDSFCCQYFWDGICISEVDSICGTPCPATCGDGWCNGNETCSSCSQDCGACPVCGDGWCDWTEDCSTCAADCGACPMCGNGQCEQGETCSNCTGDCGACVCHDTCQTGSSLDASCGACEAQICAVDPYCCSVFWDSLCVNEVGTVCGTPCPASCGDGMCDPAAESCSTCSQDCGACPVCGDGWCSWMEDCSSCAADCGACPACGNGQCEQGENCSNCSSDCGVCPGCPMNSLGSTVPQTVTGNTSGQANVLMPTCGASNAPEVTYSFTAPADGSYEFNTFGSAYDTVIQILDGSCQGSQLACNDDKMGLQSQVILTLSAGQTVIIVVDGFSTAQGAFTLNIQ